jgi:hypothetical protein
MLSPELGSGYAATRVHHASRRCGSGVAAYCARAAANAQSYVIFISALPYIWAKQVTAFLP